MDWREYDRYTQRDLVKDVLISILMMGVFYLYWLVMLLLLSLILLNVWRIKIEGIFWISAGLAAVTWVVYIIRLVQRRKKEYPNE